ncbi:MAG: membrane protein of unknown function [Candidatus Thorarchaeota archaeon]|nr:MAG: membrane protein of unknown function [Candidatus Thorarchaeota archaeon]
MGYNSKLRERINYVRKKFVSIAVTFFIGIVITLLTITTNTEQNIVFVVLDYEFVFPSPWGATIDIYPLIAIGIFDVFLWIITSILIQLSWKQDMAELEKQILNRPRNLKSLIGISKKENVEEIINKTGMNLWELILLRKYIISIETEIRQEIRARENLLEERHEVDIEEILDHLEFDDPLTDKEADILEYALKYHSKISRYKRIFAFLRIRTYNLWNMLLLADLRGEQVKSFGSDLIGISSVSDDESTLFSRESIMNLIRLIDKQYDFKIINPDEVKIAGEFLYEIIWDSRGNSHINFSEEKDLKGANSDFIARFLKSSENAMQRSLGLSGYSIISTEGERLVEPEDSQIMFLERNWLKEELERNHRLLLEDIFEGEIDGIDLELLDISNTVMAIDGYAREEKTIQEIEKRIEDPSDIDQNEELRFLLLRVNVLPQIHPDSGLDRINNGRTLTTTGLIERIEEKMGESILTKLIGSKQKVTIRKYSQKHEKPVLDIPQITGNKTLGDIMPVLDLAKIGVLDWIATGGGAWIISGGLTEEIAKMSDHTKDCKIPFLFHHPLREKVFLEVLTHQNYHYLWEILHNRVTFLSLENSEFHERVELIWSREPFQHSSIFVRLNEDSKKIIKQKTPIVNHSQRHDCYIVMTRDNQLIRSPVNALGLALVEESQRLSPLSSAVHDFVVRQKTFEETTRCLSTRSGLVENGMPTRFCWSINWLQALSIDQKVTTEYDFKMHKFSNPWTWNRPGFLDILVREVKCAYSILKVLATYQRFLRNDEKLPFRLIHKIPKVRIRDDIRHLRASYDFLCDFLAGKGHFSQRGIQAVGEHDGYLDWLALALEQLEDIGNAMGIPQPFISCRETSVFWLNKLHSLLDELGDPLRKQVERTTNALS